MNAAKPRVSEQRTEEEIRCGCGSLLARRTSEGIELKCRRCHRCVLLRIHADGEVTLVDQPQRAS